MALSVGKQRTAHAKLVEEAKELRGVEQAAPVSPVTGAQRASRASSPATGSAQPS